MGVMRIAGPPGSDGDGREKSSTVATGRVDHSEPSRREAPPIAEATPRQPLAHPGSPGALTSGKAHQVFSGAQPNETVHEESPCLVCTTINGLLCRGDRAKDLAAAARPSKPAADRSSDSICCRSIETLWPDQPIPGRPTVPTPPSAKARMVLRTSASRMRGRFEVDRSG